MMMMMVESDDTDDDGDGDNDNDEGDGKTSLKCPAGLWPRSSEMIYMKVAPESSINIRDH